MILEKKISSCFIIMLALVLCSGCAVKEKEKKIEETTQELPEGYTARYGTYESTNGDGWIYVMEISYLSDGTTGYYLDVINEKYEKMKGYTIKVIGEQGEVMYELEPGTVSMGYNDGYSAELHAIEEFLERKNFTEKISLEELEELELKKLDKHIIVDVFNKAITSELRTEFGPSSNDPYAKLYVGEEKNGKKWQAFVLAAYGYIDRVKIDYVSDGKYFSEKSKKELTKEEKKLKKDMELIEQWVQEEDVLEVKHEANELKSKEGKELLKFIKTMRLDEANKDEKEDEKIYSEVNPK